MRQGQQSRRGRNRGRKPQNAISRNYESSGPDVKIRGTAMHIAEKYASLARDAMAAGDNIAAENYLQHAEHYNRIIMAAQAQHAPGHEGMNGANGGGRYNEPFQRDFDNGDGESDDEDDDFVPQQRPRHQERHVNYNQHQQPQPYVPHGAFPQVPSANPPQAQPPAQVQTPGNGVENGEAAPAQQFEGEK